MRWEIRVSNGAGSASSMVAGAGVDSESITMPMEEWWRSKTIGGFSLSHTSKSIYSGEEHVNGEGEFGGFLSLKFFTFYLFFFELSNK